MNPFVTPDHIYISTTPRDMRSGLEKLAYVVTTTFGTDPADGSLYVFVSRDAKKIKAIRYDNNGWVLYHLRLSRNSFKWGFDKDTSLPCLSIDRRELLWLLEGLEIEQKRAAKPVTHHVVL